MTRMLYMPSVVLWNRERGEKKIHKVMGARMSASRYPLCPATLASLANTFRQVMDGDVVETD